jgi:hypothetical protein
MFKLRDIPRAVCFFAFTLILNLAAAPAGSEQNDAETGPIVYSVNSTEGWGPFGDANSVIKLSSVFDDAGHALAITYHMHDGVWLGAYNDFRKDLSAYKGIRFKYRGEGAKNSFEVKLESPNGATFGYMVETKSNPDLWTTVEIPFTELRYWTGSDQTLNLKKARITFAVSKKDPEDEGGLGKIFIGNVQGYGAGTLSAIKDKSAKPVSTALLPAAQKIMPDGFIDDMADAPAGWDSFHDYGSKIQLGSTWEQKNQVLEIAYDMEDGAWVDAWRQVFTDISRYGGVKFMMRGQGAQNSVEFKMECGNGSNWGKILPVKSNVAGWTTCEILFSDLAYWWGGTRYFDLNRPKIHLAVTRKEGDAGGSGTLLIDKIELIKNQF